MPNSLLANEYQTPKFEGGEVFIQKPRTSSDQLHCGLIYVERGNPRLLHLQWHYDLENIPLSEFQGKLFWIKPTISFRHTDSLNTFCRVLANHKTLKVPYGLNFVETAFKSDGNLTFGSSEFGLTCATFVMAVFEYVSQPLIDKTNWDYGDSDRKGGDEQWQKGVWNTLQTNFPEEESKWQTQIDAAVEKSPFRYRPNDIFASCSSALTRPVSFDQLDAISQQLQRELTK